VASGGSLTAVAHGEVEVEEGVLVIRRIHVVFTLTAVDPEKVATAQRAHEAFKLKCPVYRSIYQSIAVTTELTVVEARAT
jgi:uncharacterized OsmC-like protein